MRKFKLAMAMLLVAGGVLSLPSQAHAGEFVVYSVFRGVDLGVPGETPPKDFFVNMGSNEGIRPGTVLEVWRRTATYDLMTEKLYKDVTYPIARLKVIHSENNAAIARLDKMLPLDKTPSSTPYAVMVGDIVRPAN